MNEEQIKRECLKIAEDAWYKRQYLKSFVVGFRDEEYFSILMPWFADTDESRKIFLATVTLEAEWDGIAMFHQEGMKVTVTLIVPGGAFISCANVVSEYGGLNLAGFSNWQNCLEPTLEACVLRDIERALANRRVENG
jgi:hypothetical protein